MRGQKKSKPDRTIEEAKRRMRSAGQNLLRAVLDARAELKAIARGIDRHPEYLRVAALRRRNVDGREAYSLAYWVRDHCFTTIYELPNAESSARWIARMGTGQVLEQDMERFIREEESLLKKPSFRAARRARIARETEVARG